MYDWLAAHWSRWALWIALISLGVTTVVVIVWERQFSASTGGIRLLDTYIWLAPPERYSLINAFGSEGRQQQKWFWAFGSLHSVVEYSTAALAAVGLTRALSLEGRGWRLLVAVAAAGLFVELLENVVLMALLEALPRRSSTIAWASTGITVAKFAVKISLWGTLAALFGWWIARELRERRTNRVV
jgi:hypothetical protein